LDKQVQRRNNGGFTLYFSGSVITKALRSWWAHNPPRLGAALAYYTVLSLAPLLVILVAIAGHFFGADAARGQLYWQVRNVTGEQSAVLVQSLLRDAARHSTSGFLAGIFGFALLLVGASGVFSELRDDLNYIWDVPVEKNFTWKEWLRQRARSFLLVLAAGVLVVLSLTVSLIIRAASEFTPTWMRHPGGLELLNLGVTFLGTAIVIALMYRFLPAARVDWEDVAIGSAVTAVLVVLGKTAVTFYLVKAGVGSTYGAAGSVVVLLVWVYCSSQIFLLGAEFTRMYALSRDATGSRLPSSVESGRVS
jgi:membrane protein